MQHEKRWEEYSKGKRLSGERGGEMEERRSGGKSTKTNNIWKSHYDVSLLIG